MVLRRNSLRAYTKWLLEFLHSFTQIFILISGRYKELYFKIFSLFFRNKTIIESLDTIV